MKINSMLLPWFVFAILLFIIFPFLLIQTLNLLINIVQNTKDVYKHLMEDNMPGGSTKKIYEYLAGVSRFSWRIFCEEIDEDILLVFL